MGEAMGHNLALQLRSEGIIGLMAQN